jgi:hypothetical protein
MTYVEAKAISDRLRHAGFLMCTAAKVRAVADGESLEDAALESAILQELER